MLRSLGRLVLLHALQLQATATAASADGARAAPPTEVALAAALADGLLPSVPCFRAHWRPMARAVLQLLQGGGADEQSALPPLYREVLRVVERDALIVGGGVSALAR